MGYVVSQSRLSCWFYLRFNIIKDILLSVTNTFEGRIFVSETIVANQTVADYISQLMPQFTEREIEQTVKAYANIGSNDVLDQAIAIMGECASRYHLFLTLV